MRPQLGVDFDGVLHAADMSIHPRLGPPMPGAVEAMQNLHPRFTLVVFTVRGSQPHDYLDAWLQEHGIPYDSVSREKPNGWIIDDRAIRFHSWDQTLRELAQTAEYV